jgi:Ni,Fe-hydrogenase III small subunit/NAD-dependent dihydropyrimidine dehydrogenase PreA subunit
MLKTLSASFKQGRRTIAYPNADPTVPDRFRGLPILDSSQCPNSCQNCTEACPTGALTKELNFDLGRCLFCGECLQACPAGAIRFTRDYRLAARKRTDLILKDTKLKLIKSLDKEAKRLFHRSLKLRQVSAGGCNACEADTNVLSTVVFDVGRFGIQFVASPRHADGILITGPVTKNMRLALDKTYAAVPSPKIVIVVGACAISGGPYIDLPEVHNGADQVLPVDLYIPGCPPHPITILDGFLRLLGRL